MVIPSPRAETNLVEVTLLARLHADLPEHHAREQPHVPREHVQPNLVVGGRTLREVGQVGADAIAEHLEQRRVVLERRARRRGRDDPAEQGREVHRDGGLLPVVVKLQVGRRRHLDGGASLDGLATYARAKANDKAPVSLPRALLSRASIAASIVPLRSRPIHESRPSPDPLARVVRTEPAIGLRAIDADSSPSPRARRAVRVPSATRASSVFRTTFPRARRVRALARSAPSRVISMRRIHRVSHATRFARRDCSRRRDATRRARASSARPIQRETYLAHRD